MDIPEQDWTDIGHGLSIAYYSSKTHERAGIFLKDANCKIHDECIGSVPFTGRAEWNVTWEVLQDDPLTLNPSIQRTPCELHGYIRNGRWEPC